MAKVYDQMAPPKSALKSLGGCAGPEMTELEMVNRSDKTGLCYY